MIEIFVADETASAVTTLPCHAIFNNALNEKKIENK